MIYMPIEDCQRNFCAKNGWVENSYQPVKSSRAAPVGTLGSALSEGLAEGWVFLGRWLRLVSVLVGSGPCFGPQTLVERFRGLLILQGLN